VDNFLKIVMHRTGRKFIFIPALFFILWSSAALPQNQTARPTRQSALDAYSKGNFELAYIQFNELLTTYTKDPLYKYFCGVSLVKLEKDPVKASSLLKEALQGSAAIRQIPSDGLFYLGRAQQMSGNFSEAIKSYNLYTEQVGKKVAREVFTSQFIQQCNEKKGEIVPAKTPVAEINKNDSLPTVKNEKIMPAEEIGNHNPDTAINNTRYLPAGYEKQLNEALNYQFRADSLMKIADLCRKQMEYAPPIEKPAIKTKISDIEQLAGVYQKMANKKILTTENLTESRTGQTVSREKKIRPDSISAQKENIPVVIQKGSGVIKDTLTVKNEKAIPVIAQITNNQVVKDTDNQLVAKDRIMAKQLKASGIYSVFEVVAKPVYTADEKVRVNSEIPAGLIYRIQLAVFRNPVALSYFKGITPVFGFTGDRPDVTNYYAGMFRKSADASKALEKVKKAGFKDAFVVALMDKKIVSSERAGVLEKEWGNKTLSATKVRKIQDEPRDTIPPTLIFRVEVTKSQKPLSTEQLDNIKRLAGNRGLDIIKNSSGQNICLIGKFLNFESAAEYADLLNRNGQKEAKVAAYLGKREIPVETAKQLFEKF
jgi:hypothetical protein